MKIQYLLMPSLMLNPILPVQSTNDDLKDVTNSVSYTPLKSEKRLARAFDKNLGEHIDEYNSIMNEKEITFSRNLVKGKIAETVFAQMLRSTGEFTVLEFGY